MVLRALVGAALALAIALLAGRMGALSRSGQWAAVVTGALASIAGWGWAVLLVAYFVTSSALTRLGRATKAERTSSVLAPATERTALQVAANGAVFAVGAVVAVWVPGAALIALGALAASAADTWATEIGLLWGGAPRSVLTFAPLEPGSSGGVSGAGLAASALAAFLVAWSGSFLIAPIGIEASVALAAVAVGGVAGSLADSVLGASVQSRRRCDACDAWTERTVHRCGGVTRHARGLAWLTNDSVNLCATAVGGGVAWGVAALLA
jgi:uncharacterized protein (TIGR00297 family)